MQAAYRTGVRGDYSKAVELFTRAIDSGALTPTERAAAHVNRGIALRRQGNADAAIADYTEALRVEPENALAFGNRGLALAKSHRYDEAIADFDRAAALDPKSAKTFLMRGNAYFDKGAYQQAIANYDRALRIAPNLRDARINRRDAAERMRRPDRPCTCTDAVELATTNSQ